MRALITGATGFVGRRLVGRLARPIVLSRGAEQAKAELRDKDDAPVEAIAWDPVDGPPPKAAFDGVDAVFHLAGESVAQGRWTDEKKRRIRASREMGTRHLVRAIVELNGHKPGVLVSASAVGFYGEKGDEIVDETAHSGDDFLSDVCRAWEAESVPARSAGVRVVNPRISLVLGADGGALPQMLPPFFWGMGSPLGSGRQWMSWIHVEDMVRLLLFAAETKPLAGAVNAAAPNPVTNRQFTKALGRVLGRPTFMPSVPGFMLRLMLGEFASVLLTSQRVVPKAATAAGFEFEFPELEPALADILSK
jgi:uncharacterized protein (TIGR01777 family)